MLLAEKGIEMTMEEASNAYSMAEDIINRSKKMSTKDIWDLLDVDIKGMSSEEKEQIANLYQSARDL